MTDWLRIYKQGDVYTAYTSLDNVNWVRGQSWDFRPQDITYPVKIGLFAFSGGPHNDVPALFDYFHVYTRSNK